MNRAELEKWKDSLNPSRAKDRIAIRLLEAITNGEEAYICPEDTEEQEFILRANPFLGGNPKILFLLNTIVEVHSDSQMKMSITSEVPEGTKKIQHDSSFLGDFAGPCIKLEKIGC